MPRLWDPIVPDETPLPRARRNRAYSATDSSNVNTGAAEQPVDHADPASSSLRSGLGSFAWAAIVVLGCAIVTGVAYRHMHLRTCTAVLDGDTFAIRRGNARQLVQLAGADAPEIHKNEPFALESRQFLEDMILHKHVWLEYLDSGDKTDYKNRLLCWVWVDGKNLNYELVARGLARISGAAEGADRTILSMLEDDAKASERGMWAAPHTP